LEGVCAVLGTLGCSWLKPPLLVCAGAGFASQDLFLHGFFSAAVKLPADYAAGVVVAFYVSSPFLSLISVQRTKPATHEETAHNLKKCILVFVLA
jgi:hypothetical protein